MYMRHETCSDKKIMANSEPLIEGKDFYWDELGRMVLTAEYLRARGTCCENACKHCPYGFLKDKA